MKAKLLGIILAIAVLFASAVPAFAADDVRPGDANLDGKLNLMDCSFILKYIAKWDMTGWTFSEENADFNGDGRINLMDVGNIMRRCANPWFPGKDDNNSGNNNGNSSGMFDEELEERD